MSNATRGETIEQELWARYERRLARRVNLACGALLAIIVGFNVWLVWLIWIGR